MSTQNADRLPRVLAPVDGELDPTLVERVVATLGPDAKSSRALQADGLVTPSALTPLTLMLLSGQPRASRRGEPDGVVGARAVAGGVWVRERITYHHPVRIGAPLVITGETVRRVTRKGRLFTTTRSETRDAEGRLLVTSFTTGLGQYRPDPDLVDAEEGLPEQALAVPAPDPGGAAANPGRAALAALAPGASFDGPAVDVSLELLQLRDGKRAANPIHTDPEVARRAGLAAPIAGGSHVLGFVQESLMNALGPEVLLHGAAFDVRFAAPVAAGTRAERRARVVDASDGVVTLELEVASAGRPAMTGTARLPFA